MQRSHNWPDSPTDLPPRDSGHTVVCSGNI